MNTEQRLDRLEKQNRNLRRGLVGLLLLLSLVGLAWQRQGPVFALQASQIQPPSS